MSSQYRFRNVIVTTNITSNGIFRSNYRLLSEIVVTYIFKYNETNGDLYINVSTDKIKNCRGYRYQLERYIVNPKWRFYRYTSN